MPPDAQSTPSPLAPGPGGQHRSPGPARPGGATPWPLRWHLLAILLAVLLPTLVFAGSLVWQAAQAERARLERRAADAARELAATLDRDLADVMAVARVLAGSESLAAGDLAAFHRRALDIQRELGAANISLRDARSRQVLNTSVPWGRPLPDGARLAPLDRVVEQTGRPAFSGVYEGLAARTLLYAVVVPVPPPAASPAGAAEGGAPRFLSLAMPLGRVQRILEREVTLDAGMVAAIADGANRFVARSRDPETRIGAAAPNRPPPPAPPEAGRGAALRRGLTAEGAEVLIAYRWSELAGWVVGVSVPEEALSAAGRRALLWLGLGGAGALALGLLAALAVGRRLTGAMASLAEAGHALGRGEPVPALGGTGVREVDLVATALREGAERLRRVQRIGRVGGFEIDLLTQRNFRSREYLALQGLPPDAVSLRHEDWVRRLHPEDRERAERRFWEAVSDESGEVDYAQEYRIVTPAGETRWIAARARVERDPATGRAVRMLGAHLDVTDLKRAEAALREGEARLRAFHDGAPIGIALLDRELRHVEVNGRMAGLLGRPAAETIGRTVREALRPEVAARLEPLARRALEGETMEGVELELPAAAEGAGAEPRSVLASCHPIRAGEGGAVTGVSVAAVDITARRAAERELARYRERLEQMVEERTRALAEAQAQLVHARRMEALGQLAGGIAHDFNNVLQAVQGGAALVAHRAGEGDAEGVRRVARMVGEAAERGASVTRRLLAFARRGDLRAEAVEPGALLHGLGEVLAHTLGAGIEVRAEAEPDLPPLLADKGQLETVLLNLATNARDAMGGRGALALRAALERVGPEAAPGESGGLLRPGRYLRLSVADDGPGMDAETLARATEPFFTTKGTGQGTGLGLAMAKGFAEQSGGALALESAPGRGTVVTLWLPVAPAGAPGTAAGAGPPSAAEAGAGASPRPRVLLVDDEPAVREITAEQLRLAGFAVRPAAGAAEALALLDAGEAADLLVSDLSMPGVDGVALIREAQRRRPRLPAILLTGFATNAAELAVGGALSGSFSLLRKPVDAQALADRIAVMLEGAAGVG